jgi:xanthine dehydrogenase accessory factor
MKLSGHVNLDSVRALSAARDDGVLAVVSEVIGPAYRPVGAMMAVFSETERVGSLSSGCVETDIALHAMRALETGRPQTVRYGAESPYVDIQLPCGGGLEILLIPRPDRPVLDELLRNHEARRASTLAVDVDTGDLSIVEGDRTERSENRLYVRIEPEIMFNIFGKGPEASTLAALANAAGYDAILFSPDHETLEAGSAAGCSTRRLDKAEYPDDLDTDDRTAILLLFHDHDWEPPILAGALRTPAFYVGAKGSRKASETRLRALEDMGIPVESRSRLRGPIGLIPSARDPKTLAVSVLAEVLDVAMQGAP